MNLEAYREHFTHFGPPSCGGHTPDQTELLDTLVDVIKTSGAKIILEIGFNQGGSALVFLMDDEVEFVTSIDIHNNEPSVNYLNSTFGGRFQFIQANSQELDGVLSPNIYDLAYIDGNHDNPYVENDVNTCLDLNIPYLLFDDTYHLGHPNIRRVVDDGVKNGRWTIVKEYPIGVGKTLVKVIPQT